MKQSLLLIVEQIEAGLFDSVDLVKIITQIIIHMDHQYPEEGSPMWKLRNALKVAITEWNEKA